MHSALADTESLKRKEVLETLGECDVDLLDLQIMLLSDGSVTRHLQLITGNQIKAVRSCSDPLSVPSDSAIQQASSTHKSSKLGRDT